MIYKISSPGEMLSSMVPESSSGCCGTRAKTWRSWILLNWLISQLFTSILPFRGGYIPMSRLAILLLPHPLFPTIPVMADRGIEKSNPLKRRGLDPYLNSTFWNWISWVIFFIPMPVFWFFSPARSRIWKSLSAAIVAARMVLFIPVRLLTGPIIYPSMA